MSSRIKVSLSDPEVKRVVKATFPDYRGRTVYVSYATRPVDVTSYWSGGSRSYFKVIDLRDGRVLGVPQNGTPFDGGPIRPEGIEVPPGFAIVEHVIFCGRDLGIRIHVNPDTGLLTEGK
jgi:hypothetical protein